MSSKGAATNASIKPTSAEPFGPPINEENMNVMIVDTCKQINEIYEMTKQKQEEESTDTKESTAEGAKLPPDTKESTTAEGAADSIGKDLESTEKVSHIVNNSASISVMLLVIPIINEMIIKNQLIINDQLKEFDQSTGLPDTKTGESTDESSVGDSVGDSADKLYIQNQLEARSKLITLISQFNCKVCILIINCFKIIGSAAYGIAEKTFPIDVILHLTEMVANIVSTGDQFNKEIKHDLNKVKSLDDQNPRITSASKKAAENIEKSRQAASQGVADATQGATQAAAEGATQGATQAAAEGATQAVTQTLAKGGTNKKKNIHSLKKKYLFNQKTLKIRNRLHKLLLR